MEWPTVFVISSPFRSVLSGTFGNGCNSEAKTILRALNNIIVKRRHKRCELSSFLPSCVTAVNGNIGACHEAGVIR